MTTIDGTVLTEPRYFFGTRTHATHEQFDIASDSGTVRVIDNVALAPRVPVHPGDRVEVRGELVHDAGQPPIIHWTHHDPAHHHPDGFIRFHDRLYA